jgi:hypothetical protein
MLFADIKQWLENQGSTPSINDQGHMQVNKWGRVGYWKIIMRSLSNDQVEGFCEFQPNSRRLEKRSFRFTIESLATFECIFNSELDHQEWCNYL